MRGSWDEGHRRDPLWGCRRAGGTCLIPLKMSNQIEFSGNGGPTLHPLCVIMVAFLPSTEMISVAVQDSRDLNWYLKYIKGISERK